MFVNGWTLTLVTFPGVVLHEIAHRFFCDIYKVPVFHVSYYDPFSTEAAGCVLHEVTKRFRHAFFISIAPLIVNSIICIMLTFPYGIESLTESSNVFSRSPVISYFYIFIFWVGFSTGLHAIPSRTDIENFLNVPRGNKSFSSMLAIMVAHCIKLTHIPYLGFIVAVLYVGFLSHIIPFLILRIF
jgi:hypothetical protein